MLYGQITLGTVLRTAAGSTARLIETTHGAHSRLGWHEHEDLSLDIVLDGSFREDVGGEQLTRLPGRAPTKPRLRCLVSDLRRNVTRAPA